MLQLAPGGRLLGGRVFQLASKERHWEEGCSSFHRWKGVGRKGVAVPRGGGCWEEGCCSLPRGEGTGDNSVAPLCAHPRGRMC